MLSDYHVHTSFSADSETPMEDQVRRAIDLGMERICFTDHHDEDAENCELTFLLDRPAYHAHIDAMRKKYSGRIKIGRGIELGLQMRALPKIYELASEYPYDFIIGSCHFIDSMDPYYPEYFADRSLKNSVERFYEVTLQRVKAFDCFHVLGHVDYIKRYIPPDLGICQDADFMDMTDEIFKTLIEKGKGIECNTGGLRHSTGCTNPSEKLLKRYRELGGEIVTVGSDAHVTDHLGYGFERVRELLAGLGYKYYTVFEKGSPVFVHL